MSIHETVFQIIRGICSDDILVYWKKDNQEQTKTIALYCCRGDNNKCKKDSVLRISYDGNYRSYDKFYQSLTISSSRSYNTKLSNCIFPKLFQVDDSGYVSVIRKIRWTDNEKVLCIGNDYYYDFCHESLVHIQYSIDIHDLKLRLICRPPLCDETMYVTAMLRPTAWKDKEKQFYYSNYLSSPTPLSKSSPFQPQDYSMVEDKHILWFPILRLAVKAFQSLTAKEFAKVINDAPLALLPTPPKTFSDGQEEPMDLD